MTRNRRISTYRSNGGPARTLGGHSAGAEAPYTPDEIDRIARSAAETVVARPGAVCEYDVEAYERVSRSGRRRVAAGVASDAPQRSALSLGPRNGVTDGHPYLLRIGGFRRDHIFGAEEAGRTLAKAGIGFADSIGNGLIEHLALCRRNGIRPLFEAPSLGFQLPFLSTELARFRSTYRAAVREWRAWLKRIESIYGAPLLSRSAHPWLLYGIESPLALFVRTASKNPAAAADELQAAAGVRRLDPSPATPVARAAQIRAWTFLRRRHMEVRAIMAEEVRSAIAVDAVLIDNAHTLPVLDYDLLGRIYDHPGVAVRSGYLEEAARREPYIGYAVRLFSDLTGRTPVASVRINQLCAGARCIPRRAVVRQWCDAAVRHGAAGFYFWPVDYPARSGAYKGAMAGNPDPRAHGRERWNAMLEVFRDLSEASRFCPPRAEIGILVPDPHIEIEGWREIMRLFIQFEQAKVWSRLVSIRHLVRENRRTYRVLFVPAMPFASDAMVAAMLRHLRDGGLLIVSDPEFAHYDLDGKLRPPFAGFPAERAGAAAVRLGCGLVCRCARGRENEYAQAPRHAWVYDVTSQGLSRVTGAATGHRPAREPEIALPHYLYEHSSSWMDFRTNTEAPSAQIA